MSGTQGDGKGKPPEAASSGKPHEPGDGLRSIKTTSVFRAVNFELYAKPNKVIMAAGVIAISLCTAYLAYMRTRFDNISYYVAVEEDGSKTIRPKKTAWD